MDQKTGHKGTFIQLMEANKGIIHKICLMYTSNLADKEDLYQEISLQLWRSFRTYRSESKFSTWLYRVALNTAISSVRKNRRRIETVQLDQAEHFVVRDSESEGMTQMLFKALSSLNKMDRAIILLWLEEKEYAEISDIIGISQSAVSVRLVRIRARLKSIMKNLEYE
jgi:RNA polymerase sigma-70 factor (ECF subfamily)